MDESNRGLMALIDRHGLRKNIILLGPRQDIPQIMSALDVHVLSSCAEGLPNVVAEAMAAVALCVVPDVGDAAMIVNVNAWFVTSAASDALGRAILSAVSSLGAHQLHELYRRARDNVKGGTCVSGLY